VVAVQNNFSLHIKYKGKISINKIKIVGRGWKWKLCGHIMLLFKWMYLVIGRRDR